MFFPIWSKTLQTRYTPGGAFMTGVIAFGFGSMGDILLFRLRLDDPLSAFGIHGISGFWGIMAVPFFAAEHCLNAGSPESEPGAGDAVPPTLGLFYGGTFAQFWTLFWNQFFSFVVLSSWSFGTTFLFCFIGSKITAIRCPLVDEIIGTDKGDEVRKKVAKISLKEVEIALVSAERRDAGMGLLQGLLVKGGGGGEGGDDIEDDAAGGAAMPGTDGRDSDDEEGGDNGSF